VQEICDVRVIQSSGKATKIIWFYNYHGNTDSYG